MGRKVRRVPANWQHPKSEDGSYIPLLGRSYAEDSAEWIEEKRQWKAGFTSSFDLVGNRLVKRWVTKPGYKYCSYEEYAGGPPDEGRYMPDWHPEQRTHWQMYEDTTEGTPISPVFETPEALARWLADNGASAFADMTATYEQWLTTINRGSAVSMVLGPEGMMSGVEAAAE